MKRFHEVPQYIKTAQRRHLDIIANKKFRNFPS